MLRPRPVPLSFVLKKRLEDPLDHLAGNARTGIRHGDERLAVPVADGDLDGSVTLDGLARVNDHVGENLFDLGVAAEGVGRVDDGHADGYPPPVPLGFVGPFVPGQRHYLLGKPRQVDCDRLADRCTAPELQDSPDDIRRVVGRLLNRSQGS